ncbi:unannotated protein [freshwater metagenome]|uniref:Unannotated protein n=1 Tax=freshwater metagenome TaxID=449393 RepID=A0A6J5YFX1_9ZZZZ
MMTWSTSMSATAKPKVLAGTGVAKVMVVVAVVSSSTRVLRSWVVVEGPDAPKTAPKGVSAVSQSPESSEVSSSASSPSSLVLSMV